MKDEWYCQLKLAGCSSNSNLPSVEPKMPLKGLQKVLEGLLNGFERLGAGALRCCLTAPECGVWEAETVSEPLHGRFC